MRIANRSSRPVLVAAVLGVLITGCPPGMGPTKPRRLSLNAQRINAMISIHAHAELKKINLPKQLRIIDLDSAVNFLIADTEREFFAKARRRRAIAKLFAYNASLFHGRLVALAGSAILDKLETAIATGTEEEKEKAANDKLTELQGSPFANCTPKVLSYNVDATDPMTISSSVEVQPSSFATLQRALDPQNWDICSKFWNPPQRTYLATRTGTNVTMNPAKTSDTPYHEEIYEHFNTTTCVPGFLGGLSCHTADFENMLDITSAPGSGQAYRADYEFVAPPIRGTMDGVPVTIETDDGHLSTAPAGTPGRWVVEGKKFLKFHEDVANTWARLAFGYAVKELAAEISDIACCDVTAVSAKLEAPTLMSVDSVP